MEFHVPDGWERFFEEVRHDTVVLIDRSVLTGIDKLDLDGWLSNFSTPEEQYLAAHLLRALIFRSNPMLKMSCQQIASFILPKLLNKPSSTPLKKFIDDLCNRGNPLKVLFSPVEATKPPKDEAMEPEKQAGKSGDSILRMFLKEVGVPHNTTIQVDQWHNRKRNVEHLIFLDDMCGTGTQFKSFYENYKLSEIDANKAYIPLFAHEDGLKELSQSCPDVTVLPVETLTKKHNFFREEPNSGVDPLWALDQSNSVRAVKEFYGSLLERYGIPIKSPFGFGDLGLTVFSSESTHNNGLHTYYTTKNTDKWTPLLKR